VKALLAWLDDRINPIVVKELRQAVQSRLVAMTLLAFLVLQTGMLSLYLIVPPMGARSPAFTFHTGQDVFLALQSLLLFSCMLFVPFYAGGRLAVERSEANVDLLFISSLTPRSIIAGKFLAATVLLLLLFSASAPFMTFTYLLRGVDLPTILLVLAIDFAAVLAATQTALLVGAAPGGRHQKAGLTAAVVLVLAQATVGVWLATVFLIHEGPRLALDGGLFWAAAGTVAAVLALLTGLQFCWSVALISPTSANRALPVRIYFACGALTVLLLAGAWALGFGSGVPLLVGATVVIAMSCLQLLIATNERDAWGPRVARTIPRDPLRRAVAFLFYSGAAGGVLFALLCLGLAWLSAWAWQALRPDPPTAELWPLFVKIWGALALYTVCYGLTATLVRRLLGRWVKRYHTWAVGAALMFLSSALPYLALYVLYPEPQFRPRGVETRWLVANPLTSIPQLMASERVLAASSRSSLLPAAGPAPADAGEFSNFCLGFVGCWAGAAALLSLPWFWGQARRFRPAGADAAPAAGVAA
jgi:hypothetical protein